MTVAPAPFEVDVDAFNALPEAEQHEELARIAQLNALVEANPMYRQVPHLGELGWKQEKGIPLTGHEQRGQVEFLEIALPYGAYVAGTRAGKTHGGALHALIQTLPVEFLPPWLVPYKRWGLDREMRVRVIGVDIANWLVKAMLPKLRKLIPPAALHKGSWEKAWRDRDRQLLFADGSWWDFLTHDMDVDAFASADLDLAWFDEEPTGERGKQQYEETLGRLTDRDGEVRWTLTPLLGLNFVYHELTDRFGNPRDDDECKVVTGDIDHNPHLSDKGRARFLKKFAKDPLKLAARKSGRWVHFAGLIYPGWSEKRHVVPERPIPRAHAKAAPLVPVFEAIDPGINEQHKAAYVVGWLDFEDVFEVFYSIAMADQNVEQVAAHIHEVRAALNFKPRWTKIDPSAKNRQHISGKNVQDTYRKHGVHTIPAQNSHALGFDAMNERLDSDRLKVQAQCEGLIQFFGEYRWKSPRGQQVDKPKAEPIKRNDDELDALRYLIVDLPKAPAVKEDEELLDGPTRAFREHLKMLRRGRIGRVGGAIPMGRLRR